ncbi:zinc finger AN1-type containing 1 [Phyllostomus discolor]|uniref:Zinc finger AN1-type containing 1 n=1 Tax=Phyllostomus discolor TaxID=89673 RepID=A0A834E2Z2_9CHIR|nr:zinc finger AN1-type containing 1 [Phyllostomus discolor]
MHTSYPCSYKECVEKELVPVICPYCEKNFCLRHRHQSDHECEKLEIPKPRMATTQKLVKDIIDSKTGETAVKRRKGAKNSATAAKVALMKLKMHAEGDKSLPQTERVYLQVFLPKESKEKSKPMFFCRQWSIGKVIDLAASLASLKNNNNKLTGEVTTGYNNFFLEALRCATQASLFITVRFISLVTEIKVMSHDFRRSITLGSYFGNVDC